MKKKIVTLILTIATMLMCIFGFSACEEQHTHEYAPQTTKVANCTEKGLITYTCSCGDSYTEEISATGVHTWDDGEETKASTCTKEGETTYTCTVCKTATKTEPIGKLTHEYGTEWESNATHHWHECGCGDKKDEEEHTTSGPITENTSQTCTACNYVLLATAGIIYEITDGEASVVGYEGTETNVRIAYNYNGVPVTSIGERAFYNCESLTSIVIPDSVTTIGDSAFFACSNLTSVEIGDSVTSIDSWAFYGCINLKNIKIPDNVTSVGELAFALTNLTNLEIGAGLKSIGVATFAGNGTLTSILVSENNLFLKSIDGNLYTKDGKTLLQYATGKTESSFTVPEGVISIGTGAFGYSVSLISVIIPDSVTTIADRVFYGCSSLTSVVIGDGVTSIGDLAFSGCDSLTSVYYKGTANDWSKISVGSYNDELTSATCYYYSGSEPTTAGNYWYCNENGEIVVW